jgi:nicotinamidase-related amidase
MDRLKTFKRESSALLVIDLQERLAAAMRPEALDRVINRTLAAITGARALGMPIVVTEQYPKGLGPTLKAVRDALGDAEVYEKLAFSAWLPQVQQKLTARPNVLITGMETHVCVFQTVRDLAAAGLTAWLAVDAVLSRNEVDHQTGVALAANSGAVLTTVETALFDALGRAGGPEFKAISAAVK